MSTVIRPKLSKKNKYWINKHRYYELKHFCLQYPLWVKIYRMLDEESYSSPRIDRNFKSTSPEDLTAKYAITKAHYWERIKMVKDSAEESDEFLSSYILRAVTEGLSFNYLQTKLGMPCSKDTYYDRYRKFFWILSKKRE